MQWPTQRAHAASAELLRRPGHVKGIPHEVDPPGGPARYGKFTVTQRASLGRKSSKTSATNNKQKSSWEQIPTPTLLYDNLFVDEPELHPSEPDQKTQKHQTLPASKLHEGEAPPWLCHLGHPGSKAPRCSPRKWGGRVGAFLVAPGGSGV